MRILEVGSALLTTTDPGTKILAEKKCPYPEKWGRRKGVEIKESGSDFQFYGLCSPDENPGCLVEGMDGLLHGHCILRMFLLNDQTEPNARFGTAQRKS